MYIRWKIPPVVCICLILWFGALADSQTANSESSHGSQLSKSANTGSGIQTFSIQPTSSAEFTDLHTQNVSTFSSGQSLGATNILELNSRTLTTIQDIRLTPSLTELGSVPSVLPSSSVSWSRSEAVFSSSSEISSTARQLPSLTTELIAEASLSTGSNISSTSEFPSSSPYDSTSEFQSSESALPSSSQDTNAIQPTSTVWGSASNSDTLLQSTAAESTFYSEFPSLTISIPSTQYSHFSSSFTSKTQSSFLSSSSSSVVITPTATILTTTTSTPGYVTLTPPSKPSGSGSPTGHGEKTPSQKETGDLSSGAKTTIAIIATLCVLGVIIAGVLLYRRYNITHRSLKTFLTSGVRYKTYNNATYKDDEGMLIMPDRR